MRRLPAVCLLAVAFGVFVLLATMNAAGYRYGASDQAFYIPAVLRHLDPALFPQDRTVIDGQSRLIVVDEILAEEPRLKLELPHSAGGA